MGTTGTETLRVVEERADAEFARRTLQSGLALIPFTLVYAGTTEMFQRLPLWFAVHVAISIASYVLRLVWVKWGWPRYYASRPDFWRHVHYGFVLVGTASWAMLSAVGASMFGFETWTGFMLLVFLVGYCAASMTHLIAHFWFFVAQMALTTVPMMIAVGLYWGDRALMVNAVLAVYLVFLAHETRILHTGYRASLLNARMLEVHAAEVDSARRVADSANETKSQFLVTVSHQIRTPMNGILGLTRLALDTPLNAEQREYIDGARSSAESLLGLLNGLLDFSRIEANQVQLREAPFDPRELVFGIDRHFAPLAKQKGLRFRVLGLEPNLPHLVGDAMRIRQVLTNLLSNAIKFTNTGSVWLDVRVKTPELDRTVVEFAVGDTGVGIPADRLRKIFQPFSHAADTSLAREADGLGLGLAISQRLADSLAGAIEVESAVGRGSLFRFTLTLATAPAEAALEAAATEDFSAELKGLRVLVAEDNVTNQKLISRLLEKAGCQVQVAANGIQAVEQALAARFDLILMDIQMPEMDGLAATRRIRDREPFQAAETPIIALTANSLAGDQKLCLEAGMDGFLAKPIHPQQLYEAIAQQMRARKARLS